MMDAIPEVNGCGGKFDNEDLGRLVGTLTQSGIKEREVREVAAQYRLGDSDYGNEYNGNMLEGILGGCVVGASATYCSYVLCSRLETSFLTMNIADSFAFLIGYFLTVLNTIEKNHAQNEMLFAKLREKYNGLLDNKFNNITVSSA